MTQNAGRRDDLGDDGRVSIDAFFEEGLMPAGVAQQQARKQLAAYREGKFFKTGIAPLDSHLRLVGGDLLLVGGRAASGKTALGLQVIRNVLRQQEASGDKRPVVIFSAEMTAASLMMREASAHCSVAIESLVTRTASQEEYARVNHFLGDNEENRYLDNLFIDQSPAPSLEHMIRQMSGLDAPALMVFDYTDLAGEFAQSQQERITKITRGLKAIAKKFSIPVIALAQLNREIEKRESKKVVMSDFMHGGEQAADVALGLVRPWLYDTAMPRELVECHIAKYRNGRTGKVDMHFDEKTMRFSSAVMVRRGLNG